MYFWVLVFYSEVAGSGPHQGLVFPARHQYSCLTDEDVLFVCEMLYHYRNCNEHSRILLNLCRQICRTRQYCQVLAKKSFFDSLSAATALTQEYESAARIIRCMYKCRK